MTEISLSLPVIILIQMEYTLQLRAKKDILNDPHRLYVVYKKPKQVKVKGSKNKKKYSIQSGIKAENTK
jgi:hypothetical protein